MDQRLHILDSVYKELQVDFSASKAKLNQPLTKNEATFFDDFQKNLDTVFIPEYKEVIEYLSEKELTDYYERVKEFVNLVSERVETKAKALMDVPLIANFTSIIQPTESTNLGTWTYLGNGNFQANKNAMLSQLTKYVQHEGLTWQNHTSIRNSNGVVRNDKNYDLLHVGDVVHFSPTLIQASSIAKQIATLIYVAQDSKNNAVTAPVNNVDLWELLDYQNDQWIVENDEQEDIPMFSSFSDLVKHWWKNTNRDRQEFFDAVGDKLEIGLDVLTVLFDILKDGWTYLNNGKVDLVAPIDVSDGTQVWTAKETLSMGGFEFRIIVEGITYNEGIASVEFSKQGSEESFTVEYDVRSTASDGFFISVGTNITFTNYTMIFEDLDLDKAKTEEEIKQSFVGGFRTTGASVATPIKFLSGSFGETVTIDYETGEVVEENWNGRTFGVAGGVGMKVGAGVVESVYKLKDDKWEDSHIKKHFTLGK